MKPSSTFIYQGFKTVALSFLLGSHFVLWFDEGQDLVEYALVVALIAFGAIVSMNFLATGINTAFSDIAATLNSNIT